MKIPFYKNHIDVKDIEDVSNVLTRKTDWANGIEINLFQENLADYLGAKYCLVFNSGTSALHAALLALKIKPKQKILIPAFTFIAVANAVKMIGCEPVFTDIEDETYSLDPGLVKERISQGDIAAVIFPHFAGIPGQIDEIQKICRMENVDLIEDASEALGSERYDKKCGTFGNIGILSFAANKIISSGEGGAVVVNNLDSVSKLERLRSHGRVNDSNYFRGGSTADYYEVGYNWRMSSMAAALGNAQLMRIEKIIQIRNSISKYYDENLRDYVKLLPDPEKFKDHRTVCGFYSIRFKNNSTRNHVFSNLIKEEINPGIYFKPINHYRSYKKYSDLDLPKTYEISDTILSLPCYPGMTTQEQDLVIQKIKEYV